MTLPDAERLRQEEADSIFEFKDPRLRHMNKHFKRDELQVSFSGFSGVDEVKSAIDDIIKYNCSVLEFNYIQELHENL
jgi:hypothetical protein